MEHGCNNVTPQEETRGNREYKPRPKIPKYTFYSPIATVVCFQKWTIIPRRMVIAPVIRLCNPLSLDVLTRRFKYSIRTILALTLMVGVGIVA